MRPLIEDQKKAKEYRSQGKSIKEISFLLKKPQSSISNWVRNVELTTDQEAHLKSKNPIWTKEHRLKASKNCVETWRERRKVFQNQGRLLAKEMNTDFIAGIMLYWAEGSKNRNVLKFSNTDVHMMKFFVKFIFNFFEIKQEDINLKINCHLNNGITLDQIENFWLTELNLSKSTLYKTFIERKRVVSGIRKNRHLYGVCCISINKTEIVQKIFGAIQEYIGFKNTNWLNNGGVAQSGEHLVVNQEGAGS